jgi:hypothetical protein
MQCLDKPNVFTLPSCLAWFAFVHYCLAFLIKICARRAVFAVVYFCGAFYSQELANRARCAVTGNFTAFKA